MGKSFLKLKIRKCDQELVNYLENSDRLLKEKIHLKREAFLKNGIQESKKAKSIIDLFMIQQSKDSEGPKHNITDQDLVDDIKVFLAAGTDTTESFIVAMTFFVFEHPLVAERLRK